MSGDGREIGRRRFLLQLGATAVLQQGTVPDSLAGRGDLGTLRDPGAAGRPRDRSVSGDSDAKIQAIEQRLACSCGCTLDVFTCRTTDFTCTYSPKLHREVVALYEEGKSAQQILDAFVAKYGEKALMAPKPEGFNLAGYWLPGAVIAAAGIGLFALISRRRLTVAAATPAAGAAAPDPNATPEELERLRHALSEVED